MFNKFKSKLSRVAETVEKSRVMTIVTIITATILYASIARSISVLSACSWKKKILTA